MSIKRIFVLFAVSLNIVVAAASADAQSKLLPLQTLRDQDNTSHCWGYAMSHFLESRGLLANSQKVLINIEKDVKYWVDFQRMNYIFQSKKDFYLGENEGAWQIEFWETLLKHGKHIYKNESGTPDVWYKPMVSFFDGLPFMEEPRPSPDKSLMPLEQVKTHLRSLKSEAEFLEFAIDYLNRWYGKPKMTTDWSGKPINLIDTAKAILGNDYEGAKTTEAMVLIKPVEDGNFGWAKHLDERYWGYRYDSQKVLDLIKVSLDRNWPVTFDNVYHAMTIIAYFDSGNDVFFAVADSAPAKITWYSSQRLANDINLLTFNLEAIKDQIPPRQRSNTIVFPPDVDLDKIDNTEVPPGTH